MALILSIIDKLHATFSLNNLGIVSYFLGIEVHKISDITHLDQREYITNLLEKVQLHETIPYMIPMQIGKVLSKYDGKVLDDATLYKIVIGILQYYILTRPNIAYTINRLFQFLHSPTTSQWCVTKRLLRYLRGSQVLGINLHKSN